MAQFDIFRNKSRNSSKQFPLLLEVQSNIFSKSTRSVYIPLVQADFLSMPDKILNPQFNVDNELYHLFPLDIASASRSVVGAFVRNISDESDRVVSALDLLFARF